MKKNMFKKLITLIIILSIPLSLIGIGIKKTYALEDNLDTKVYTRKQVQEMVVSTALSLY